jgi:hypothetical protein
MTILASGAEFALLNGTTIYLATGGSENLSQGYVLTVKSVSSDGSVWLQLKDNDTMVKSEIVHSEDHFIYNKTNRTILSLKVDKIYSGSFEQNLVAFIVYQFIDSDKPVPDKTATLQGDNENPHDNNSSIVANTQYKPVIWVFGIIFILVLFYIMRKSW